MNINDYTQQATGMHYSEAIMSVPGVGDVSLILRYPNKLHIKTVEQCEFFEDFKNFLGKPVNAMTIDEMRYLKNRIAHYIEVNDLYFEFEAPFILSSKEDFKTSFPIIEIIGV